MPDTVAVIKFNTPFKTAVKAAENRNVVLPQEYYGELEKPCVHGFLRFQRLQKLSRSAKYPNELTKGNG